MTGSRAPVLALDLGGTQLRTALALPDGRLLGRRSEPTPRADAETLLAACLHALRASLAAANAESSTAPEPTDIGISAPGPLDTRTDQFIDPPNLDHTLWGFPFAPRVGAEFGLPAVMERDTQVAILAEGDFGAARGLTDYVYLTISTGIGGAVVTDGRLLRGPDGLAGELGHLTVDYDGAMCGCGARGHLEGISSGSGIARAALERGLGEMPASLVAAKEDAGDPVAAQIMEYARAGFAAAAVSIVDVFNPQRIIVGGGVAMGQGERLLGPAREAIRQHAFRRQAGRVELVQAQLGDDVGLIGALSLVALARLSDH